MDVPVEIVEVPREGREGLLGVLEGSFEGMYLWHARRTLRNSEVVLAARMPDGAKVGLIMLKSLSEGPGYVYYVAVAPGFRERGIGGRLLDEAIAYFARAEVEDVYASVEEENAESKALFASRGFERVSGSAMRERYGRIRALLMYQEMMVAPGEMLLGRRLESELGPG